VEATHAADTGDCEATYLKSGAHDSGFRWGTDPLYDNQPVSNRLLTPNHAGPNDVDHVIFNVSAGTARRSKAAEQEHLDDYHYAFGLTLGAAEESIQAVAGRSFSGTTGKAARTQAEAALRAELVARSNGNLDSLDPAAWQAGYRTLFMRSGSHRDGPGYHIQSLVESPFWNKPVGRQLSRAWRGHGVRHVDVVPGATFRLGVPSRDVVDPHANQPAPGTAVGRAEEHQGDDER
jgi:hypothetical protein